MWGGGAWKEEEALLGRRSRQGEGPRGELPAGGNCRDVRVVVLDVWAEGCRIRGREAVWCPRGLAGMTHPLFQGIPEISTLPWFTLVLPCLSASSPSGPSRHLVD